MDLSFFDEFKDLLDETKEFHKSLLEEYPDLYSPNRAVMEEEEEEESHDDHNTSISIDYVQNTVEEISADAQSPKSTFSVENLQAYQILKKYGKTENEEWDRIWNQTDISPIMPSKLFKQMTPDSLFLEVAGKLSSGSSQAEVAEILKRLQIESYKADRMFVHLFFSLAENPKAAFGANYSSPQEISMYRVPEDQISYTISSAIDDTVKIFSRMDQLQSNKNGVVKQDILKKAIQETR